MSTALTVAVLSLAYLLFFAMYPVLAPYSPWNFVLLLAGIAAGDDHRDLEATEARVTQVPHGAQRRVVGARAAHRVVDLRRGAVE